MDAISLVGLGGDDEHAVVRRRGVLDTFYTAKYSIHRNLSFGLENMLISDYKEIRETGAKIGFAVISVDIDVMIQRLFGNGACEDCNEEQLLQRTAAAHDMPIPWHAPEETSLLWSTRLPEPNAAALNKLSRAVAHWARKDLDYLMINSGRPRTLTEFTTQILFVQVSADTRSEAEFSEWIQFLAKKTDYQTHS